MAENARNEETEISPDRKIFLSGIVALSEEKHFEFHDAENFCVYIFRVVWIVAWGMKNVITRINILMECGD